MVIKESFEIKVSKKQSICPKCKKNTFKIDIPLEKSSFHLSNQVQCMFCGSIYFLDIGKEKQNCTISREDHLLLNERSKDFKKLGHEKFMEKYPS